MKIFCVRCVSPVLCVGDTRKGSAEEFLSFYGEKISDAKTVTFLGTGRNLSMTT